LTVAIETVCVTEHLGGAASKLCGSQNVSRPEVPRCPGTYSHPVYLEYHGWGGLKAPCDALTSGGRGLEDQARAAERQREEEVG